MVRSAENCRWIVCGLCGRQSNWDEREILSGAAHGCRDHLLCYGPIGSRLFVELGFISARVNPEAASATAVILSPNASRGRHGAN